MNKRILSLYEHSMGMNPGEEMNIDTDVLAALIELVGSEEEIEAAAAGYDFQNPKEWFEV